MTSTGRPIFRVHALQRMFERRITHGDVTRVLGEGKTIEQYPGDKPYPSRLVLGWIDDRPFHVVVADNKKEKEQIIITVYEPDSAAWEPGFERRKDL
jgi:hypothetical protein